MFVAQAQAMGTKKYLVTLWFMIDIVTCLKIVDFVQYDSLSLQAQIGFRQRDLAGRACLLPFLLFFLYVPKGRSKRMQYNFDIS